MITIIATRKISTDLKEKIHFNKIEIADYDFLKFTYFKNEVLADVLIDNVNPLIFTSKHSIKSILELNQYYGITLKTKKCYCINGKTSAFAAENGFEILGVGNNSKELANEIVKNKESEVLHCTSNLTRKELYEILENANLKINKWEVFHKALQSIKVDKFDGIMFFSPSQVDAFLLQNKLSENIPAFCLGSTTSSYLKQLKHNNIITSQLANEASILQSVSKYFEEKR